jgi:hypothetical protein
VNALIPALLIVLIAEIGAPLGALAAKRVNIVAFGIALLVFAAAAIGWHFSTMMAADARTLMLGVLIVFASSGQLWIGKAPRETLLGTALAISRSPAPGLAFGFAAFFGEPVTPALGALFAVAAAAGLAVLGVVVPPLARRIAGGILLVTGILLALRAFSLI